MRGVTTAPAWADAQNVFQPALPMRGVTSRLRRIAHALLISTRTPHAGSDDAVNVDSEAIKISTRTPHAGSDPRPRACRNRDYISTRTPHAGSDKNTLASTLEKTYFNPHSPCGE